MATLPKTTRKKKPRLPRRPKTGLAAAPLDNFDRCKYYFHYELEKKDISGIVKTYIKKEFSKDEAKAILANPEYKFYMYTHWAATIHWINSGLEFPENKTAYRDKVRGFYADMIEDGKKILADKKEDEDTKVIRLTPQQLLMNKINATVMTDIDELEDQWIDKEKTDLDLYNLFQKHGLKGTAVEPVRKRLEGWLLDYEDAYHKRCEQAVEGYSHLTKTELKRRIKVTNDMLADLDKIKAAAKATRKVRVPRPKSADKQVQRLKFMKESKEYKLVSVNPVTVPGAMRLFTFNVKTRALTEYVTAAAGGLEISGTSIKKFDADQSRSVRLRKPDDMLPLILKKTPLQIDKEWQKLTTKTTVPNGRINDQTILLRVMDK